MTLEQIVASTLRVPIEKLTEESSPKTVRRWDSIGHLSLVAAIEKAYGVKFSTPELVQLSSIGKLRQALLDRGKTP